MRETLSNWAGNYSYQAANIYEPETVEQIQELVRREGKVKALGTRHSFNDIADSPGTQISTKRFTKIVGLDAERRTVTVQAGVRYGELCQWLDQQGYALHNLASLPHISIAGACATGTHGSGVRLGNLATAVTQMEVVQADGELIRFSQDDEDFYGAVVHLGGLGIVTKLTLSISPRFLMQQDIYENLPLKQLENHFDELMSSTYSVSLFTDWSQDDINQVWLKRISPQGTPIKLESELFGARLATKHLHPIASLSAENCTEQMGICGAWFERLPHFKLNFTPSSGEELQSEYILPRQHSVSAIRALNEIRDLIAPLLQISEIRTIASDILWMSPSFEQDSVAIHFTWKKDWKNVRELLPTIEKRLAPFEARPHWGKLFMTSPEELQSRYPKIKVFQRLLEQHDPQGKFRNIFLDKTIFDGTA
ncbi:MAG: FAD-binding protein [Anaerolineales bacterium]